MRYIAIVYYLDGLEAQFKFYSMGAVENFYNKHNQAIKRIEIFQLLSIKEPNHST
jgi:hypothetical protein